ncbi:hypothetical protein [Actinomadura sp. 3N407]|uniref:hypothetical protein n=1 Tax=Actinomadura sp. 3N407 TaxID=3457423 RepID=UPI003FCC456D
MRRSIAVWCPALSQPSFNPRGTAADAFHAALLTVHVALSGGADLQGHLVRSSPENFERAEGDGKRFGVVHATASANGARPRTAHSVP